MAATNRNRKNILSLNGRISSEVLHGQDYNIVDGLPKSFVAAMRTLFDIMDDKKTGFVRLADIEDRWQDDGCKGMPRGVIESLRKVTPPNGLLSFERFCGGLKICLLRNQNESNKIRTIESVGGAEKNNINTTNLNKVNRPPSAPLLDLENGINKTQWNINNTATVRPNNAMPAQKTLSMPQLNPENDIDLIIEAPPVIMPGNYGPPKPPRVSLNLERERERERNQSNLDKAEIRNALQNWQMGLLMSEADGQKEKKQDYHNTLNIRIPRGNGDGQIDISPQQHGIYQKKQNSRRREPRRHTLQNGIDYNMLKRLKQIEQEKDILLQGLTAVEKARDWYFKQIAIVQDKIKYLGRSGTHMEQWTEAHQERLDLQRARVFEVNRHLMTLAESWERGGFPMHMNLALRHPGYQYQQFQPEIVNRLKQQNLQLSEEVTQKNDKLSILEREKTALIRELLQLQRASRANNQVSDELVF